MVRGYLTIGVGVIMLSFGGNRFTANAHALRNAVKREQRKEIALVIVP